MAYAEGNSGFAMTTLTITLPDEVAELAKAKGLLSTAAIEAYVRGQIRESSGDGEFPPGFDPRLRGKASPELLGSVQYLAAR